MPAFVPINDIRPFNSYVASAGETSFVFDWFVFKAEYVKVYKNDELLTYFTDYTIPVGSIGNPDGGNVVLNTPCDLNDEIVIFRQSEIKRTSGYTESGEFRASAVNIDFNYLISLIQEVNFQIEKCIVLSPSDAETIASNLILPKIPDRKGKYLAFDDNGNLVAVPSSSIDLYYHWVRITGASTIDKNIKKVYIKLTADADIKLPVVGEADDGLEVLICNLDINSFNANILPNSVILTIDGASNLVLIPGTYKKFIYDHILQKWFTMD